MAAKTDGMISDSDIRHYIYLTFARTSKPPTTADTANHFGIEIAAVECGFERLAQAHHIALAPGSHSIWMAHPFSGLPTNYAAEIEDRLYWGN